LIPLEERDVGRHKTIVRVGKPYEQIIALAEETQSDLVIMAVRGAGAMDLSVFGSNQPSSYSARPLPGSGGSRVKGGGTDNGSSLIAWRILCISLLFPGR